MIGEPIRRRSVARSTALAVIVAGSAFAGMAAFAAAPDVEWKAGLAKAVITPEKAVWLAGYGSKRAPDGKLHDLWMKALALEDANGHRAVLITSDFQGVPRVMSDLVFERLKGKFGLERHQVMFTFSHNHCGPRLGDDLVDYYPVEDEQVRLVDEYTALMVEKAVTMVGESIAKLAPASLRVGQGKATFAVNRRNNREADVPALLASGQAAGRAGRSRRPGDDGDAARRRPRGRPLRLRLPPDDPQLHDLVRRLPRLRPARPGADHPGATAMFVNTCGGDQNPLPRRSVELCRKYGRMLADGVEAGLKGPLKPVSPSLRTAFEYVELPYLKVVTREELTAALRDENAVRARWAARMLRKLDAGDRFESSYPYPVHAWRLGEEMLVIGLGAEAVVDYALRFKREFGPGTWVCGYADDMISYIPSRRVWEEGGYEGGSNLFEYGRPAFRWAGDVEDRIAATVQTLVRRVRE